MKEKRNLVPYFICSESIDKYSGRMNRAVMFADISGFTAMTELLMKKGKYGAEMLSEILNDLFREIEDIVYSNNGFIATFAGDAFTGIFSNGTDSIMAGNAIQELFLNYKTLDLGGQYTKLSIKIGISYGTVLWGIPGEDSRKTFYFKGKAVDRSAECQNICKPGEIIIDEYLKSKINFPMKQLAMKKYYLIEQFSSDVKNEKKAIPKCSNQEIFNYMFSNILDAENEFRETINIFLNFKELGSNKKLFEFVKDILNITEKSGGYFNTLDFGDKGNKMLIVFGAPIAKGNNAERALMFVDETRKLHKNCVKMGITFGNVFAGFIGNQRSTYTVLGDTVNLSARLMSKADYGEVLIDRQFMRLVEKYADADYYGKFSVKGKQQEVEIYSLGGQKQRVSRNESIIGRMSELSTLTNKTDHVKNNRNGGIVYIKGNTGSGKSMILDYIENHYNSEINIIRMRCDPVFKRSLNPFKNHFRSILGTDRNSEKNENVLANFISSYPSLEGQEAVIADIADIYLKNDDYHNLPPKDKFEVKLFVLRDYINNIISKKSLILIDDIDIADNDSIKALNIILRDSSSLPFCIVMTGRNDIPEALNDSKLSYNQIELNNLSKRNIETLIKKHLNLAVSKDVVDIIMEKSGGNPFFAAQLTAYLKNNKLLEINNDEYQLISQSIDVPSEIGSILVARIDSLNVSLREAVKHASVLGVEFQTEVLKNMLERDAISDTVMQGEAEEIWSPLNTQYYVFLQSVMRDAVYGMQMKKDITKLHLKVAVIMRMLFNEDNSYHYKIGYHYDKGEFYSDAYHYYDIASKWAAENFKNDENSAILDRMLIITNDIKKHAEIYVRKADTYFYIGDLEKSLNYYRLSLVKSRASNENFLESRALMGISEVFRLRSDYSKCIRSALRAREIAEKNNDTDNIIRTLLMTGAVNMTQGRMDNAKEDFQRAEKMTISGKRENLYEGMYTNIGNYYWNLGHYDEAIKNFKYSVKIAKKNHSIESLCSSYGNMGGVYWYKGDMKKAAAYYKKALNLAKKAGIKRIVSVLTGNMASIFITKGEYDKAIDMLNFKIKTADEMGEVKGKAYSMLNLGSVYFNIGDYRKAKSLYNEVIGIFKPLKIRYGMGITLGNLGEVHLIEGDIQSAMECFMEKLDIADSSADDKMLANTYSSIGDLMAYTGNYEDAFSSFEKSYEIVKELGVKRSIVNTLHSMGSVKRKTGDFNNADMFLNKALSKAEEMGAKSYIASIRGEMAFLKRDMGNIQEALSNAEECEFVSKSIEGENYGVEGKLILAEILLDIDKEKAFKAIEEIKAKDIRTELKQNYIKCLASSDYKVCTEAMNALKKMFRKTKKIEYKEKAAIISEKLKLNTE